ncbi:MAG: DUF5107 domain-containing protein, partial [Chitinophagaceae bacterium]|nr:DUF5107 domain-containing protein [Chitinophagaceae bacterium]
MDSSVNVWEEKVYIPTYEVGEPDKNPMFFEKRVYQGSSGVVYPNPVIEKIYDEKKDKEYTALFLENKYLKIMILPELGGRIQMAYDKIKERHFVYYNRVIKPALVGLTGPWISGGIEFNWPQHHRPSTFETVDYALEENPDGSKTVWINEIEKMFHTKATVAFTLYPDTAYIEVKAKLYNRTALPQTFLWWANPAVKVNDHYQSVFPSDVNAVFDHGKRDVSTFPIATGTYYKVNYAPGTDISMYKNIPVPTSYMAVNSDYDFVGGYEQDTQAGLLHVADHHVSPGKKQWTWGHSDFGQAWDRNLTDEDGPYIELMAGVYTDNQPDFTWLMPYETKTFAQYFMPYRELGIVKNASKNILVSIKNEKEKLAVKVYVTSTQKDVEIIVHYNNKKLIDETTTITPENIFTKEIDFSDKYDENKIKIIIKQTGKEILSYEPALNKKNNIPQPAQPALQPEDINSCEQLFLTGQHLEQYRHATYSPVPYYEEALKRDATDVRNNNALGLWYLRRGQFAKSEPYFRTAIKTITQRNPNPYNSEPYYHLGLSLKYRGKTDEAYDAFFKAAWSKAWKDIGYFSAAQIDMLRGNYELALEHATYAIDSNADNSKAYVLKAAALTKLSRLDAALNVCELGLAADKFNLGLLFHKAIIEEKLGNTNESIKAIESIKKLSRGNLQSFIEYALDYADAGMNRYAIELLNQACAASLENERYPMLHYYLAYFYPHKSEPAQEHLLKAAAASPYHCFPNRLQDINVLLFAIENNPADCKAPYYLGNLFYDKRQYEDAIKYWTISEKRNAGFATVYRNLGIAYFNKRNERNKALAYFEKAFSLNKTDARVLMELDQLYKRLNYPVEKRLSFLEDNSTIVQERDDLYLEQISLINFSGNHAKALLLLSSGKFHPWEGGEGKVSGQYLYALVQCSRKHIEGKNFDAAIELLNKAKANSYPHNLGEGKLYGAQENDIYYWLGVAYEGKGCVETAKENFETASIGLDELSEAIYYNDRQPDKFFYQALAWKKLGNTDRANGMFNTLIQYANEHFSDEMKIDYFAVSLPDLLIFDADLNQKNKAHCLYLKGLGSLGL